MACSRLSRSCYRRYVMVNFERGHCLPNRAAPRGGNGTARSGDRIGSSYGQLSPVRSTPENNRPSVPRPHAFLARTR